MRCIGCEPAEDSGVGLGGVGGRSEPLGDLPPVRGGQNSNRRHNGCGA